MGSGGSKKSSKSKSKRKLYRHNMAKRSTPNTEQDSRESKLGFNTFLNKCLKSSIVFISIRLFH
jgi:hypothetical protein